MHIKPKHQNLLLYNIMPISCISLLIILGFLTINPSTSTNKAHAEDNYIVYNTSYNVDNNLNSSISTNNNDNNITTYDLTEDGVVLEWDNRDSDYQTITGSNSEVLYRYNRFRVTAENIKKYQILANIADTANGTNGNKLTGYTNSEYNIPNGYSIDSISDANGIVGKDLTSSTTSQWGYAITIGEVTTTDNLSNLTYKAVPSAASSDIGLTDNVTALNNQAFTIAFAANIADDKPAGSYRASVGVSVVVEPNTLPNSFADYTTMQEITKTKCDSSAIPIGTEGRLKDTRDDKWYWVAKLKDGLCWMTQNLDYNGGGTQEGEDFDFVAGDQTGKYYDPGSLYCSNNTTEQCTLTSSRNNGHDAIGNYYNWYAATNGTGNNTQTTGNASGSICPSGWSLPIGNTTEEGSFGLLLSNLDTTNGTVLLTEPYYFTYSGYLGNGGQKINAGTSGNFWSSTYSSYMRAYSMDFKDNRIRPSNANGSRYIGTSIRCVAR